MHTLQRLFIKSFLPVLPYSFCPRTGHIKNYSRNRRKSQERKAKNTNVKKGKKQSFRNKVKYHRLSRWLDYALQAHSTGDASLPQIRFHTALHTHIPYVNRLTRFVRDRLL